MLSKLEHSSKDDQTYYNQQLGIQELSKIQALISFATDTFKPASQGVVFVGPSGAGKSTLLHYLVQPEQLYAEKKSDSLTKRFVISAKNLLGSIEIGHSTCSKTILPSCWQSKEGIAYWDCPGFGDTRGEAQDIANGFCITKLFQNIRQTKIVLVISIQEIDSTRIGTFLTLLKEISHLFPDLDSLKQGLCLIVTKTDRDINSDAIKDYLSKKVIVEHEKILDPKQKLLLEFFASKESKIGCFPMPGCEGNLELEDAVKFQTLISGIQYFSPKVQITISQSSLNYLEDLAKKVNMNIAEECAAANKSLTDLLKEILHISTSVANLKTRLADITQELNILKTCTQPQDFVKQYEQLLQKFGLNGGSSSMRMFVESLEFISIFKPNIGYSLENWLSQFKVSKLIQASLADPEVKYNNNILHLASPTIDSSQVLKEVRSHQTVESVIVFSCVFYLDSEGLKLQGTSLQIVTNKLSIPAEDTIIDLSGRNAQPYPERKTPAAKGRNFDGSGLTGNNGFPGLPGENGGNFYLSMKNVINPDKLVINISGGAGGKGQNGEDGTDGANGADGSYEDVFNRSEEALQKRHEIKWSERKGFWNCTKSIARAVVTFNGQVEEEYVSIGQSGKRGGNAGAGGVGGIGGYGGSHKIDLKQDLKQIRVISNKGNNGGCGADGTPGKGGADGATWHGIYINEMAVPALRAGGKAVDKTELIQQNNYPDESAVQQRLDEMIEDLSQEELHEDASNSKLPADEGMTLADGMPVLGTTALTATSQLIIKEGGKQVAQNTAKEVLKGSTLEVGKQVGQKALKEAGKQVAQNTAKEVLKGSTLEVGKQVGQKALKEAGKQVAQNTAKEVLKGSTLEVGKQVGQKALKEAGKQVAQNTAKEVLKGSTLEVGKQVGQKALKEAGKQVAQNTAKEVLKGSTLEVGKQVGQKALKEAGKQVAQNTAKEVLKGSTLEVGKQVGKKALKEGGKQMTKEILQTSAIAGTDVAKTVVTETATTAATTAAKSWGSAFGSFATSLGIGLAVQGAASLASAHVGSGWKEKPYQMKANYAPSGNKPENTNNFDRIYPPSPKELSDAEIQSLNNGHSNFLQILGEIVELY